MKEKSKKALATGKFLELKTIKIPLQRPKLRDAKHICIRMRIVEKIDKMLKGGSMLQLQL